jgi:hypothetical protein
VAVICGMKAYHVIDDGNRSVYGGYIWESYHCQRPAGHLGKCRDHRTFLDRLRGRK